MADARYSLRARRPRGSTAGDDAATADAGNELLLADAAQEAASILATRALMGSGLFGG